MVFTSRTYTTLFANDAVAASSGLVRLPLSIAPQYEARCHITGASIPAFNKPLYRTNLWTSDEHGRFLHGLELFPNGPWKEVAKVVGTKSTRQTMTHAQKYRQKIERRMRPKTRQSSVHSDAQETTPSVVTERRCATVQTQAPVKSEEVVIDFMDELLSLPLDVVETNVSADVVASPRDVHTNAFDTIFMDLEFDALLASFGLEQETTGPCVSL